MVATFVSQFHDLPGNTIKEKQQNLFKLLVQNSSLKKNHEELDSIIANLQADNHLEKIFRTDVLIFFERFKELYEDFKKGDQITIKKLSKQQWFYKKAFKEVTCNEFIDTILPNSSYSQKLRILKKIPLDEAQADIFFDGVSHKYGVYLATTLLQKCSNSKIRQVLKEFPIKLTVAQLQEIFDKEPNLIGVYLEQRAIQEGDSQFINSNPILVYIAQKNPKFFNELFQKLEFETRLGRRTTKKYIESQKTEILGKKKEYFQILNKGAAVRKMGPQLSELMFEKPNDWKTVLGLYPKKRQFEVFESCYNHLYHSKFGENIDEISEDELRIIRDVNKREELAERKRKIEGKNEYLVYVTPKLCLGEFMEKINYITAKEREKYVEFLTNCGLLNEDLPFLLKVFELVAVRLKNDDPSIKQTFLRSVINDAKKLEYLSDTHWILILDVLAALKVKEQWVYEEGTILAWYLDFLVKNKKPVKEELQKYAKSGIDGFHWSLKELKRPKVLKAALEVFLELGLPERDSEFEADKELSVARQDCALIGHCEEFNEEHPEMKIEIFENPRLLKSVRKLLEQKQDSYFTGYCIHGVQHAVCRHTEGLESLRLMYFANLKNFGRVSGIMWFLKNEPKFLCEHFDEFLNTFPITRGMNTKKLWRFVKKCTYLNLDRRTVEFCRLKLQEEGCEFKVRLIRPLSILQPVKSHLDFIKLFKPVSYKVDLYDEDVKKMYKIQGTLLKFLPFLQAPKEVFAATFDFCKGDYLQYALTPLYSSIYRLPEGETKEYIEILRSTKAVSVKKHSIFLSCVIYNEEDVKKCLEESDLSTLISTLKYFSKNPSDDLWKLLQSKLAIEKTEMAILKVALDIPLPPKYKGRFMETVWRLLDKYEDLELKKLWMSKIDKHTASNLSPEFALTVVKDNIFRSEEAQPAVANILLFCETSDKFSHLTEIFNKLKNNYWNHKELGGLARQKLSHFIGCLFNIYMDKKNKTNKDFTLNLTSIFTSVFSPKEAFDELIVLRLMACKDDSVEDRARDLIALNGIVGNEYGASGVNLLSDCLKRLFLGREKEEEERLKLCHAMIKCKKIDNDYLLILGLLPGQAPRTEEHFVLYQEIWRSLGQVENVVFQLHLNLFLKNGVHTGREWNFE